MSWALALVVGQIGKLIYLAVVFAALTAVELLLPCWGTKPSNKSRLKSAGFWLAGMIPGALLVQMVAPLLRDAFGEPLLPSLLPSLLPHSASVVLSVIVAVIAGDFVYYWFHRTQHMVPLLWRFHAVHHSVREMSGATGYHHFTDAALGILLYALPLSYLSADPFALPVLGLIVSAQGHYLHSPTKLGLGPVGRVIADNRFHRVHHSIRPEHYDKNFGVMLTFWDAIFGTAVFLEPKDWPDAGVVDFPESETVKDFLLRPFALAPPASGISPASPAQRKAPLGDE
jgi:sterol desaturase/sphingolipid hydroxylase (fatty acid hydroxylase superfamily)